jgi:hypothetical protein
MSEIWSNTDFPYMCLRDEVRTLSFRAAIRAVVRPGDVVLDVGAGSGILSFFAAEAGAGQVIAVEIDPLLCRSLRRSIDLNGFADRIRVVEGEATAVDLPQDVDVVVAELIDTGLLDEQQVPVLNALRDRGVIGRDTLVVPDAYTTRLQLVHARECYYGFAIAAPKHAWPFYDQGEGWHPSTVEPASETVDIASLRFGEGTIGRRRSGRVRLDVDPTVDINAVRLSGRIALAAGIEVGATHALNGDKVLAIPTIEGWSSVDLQWSLEMGGGLGSLLVAVTPAAEAVSGLDTRRKHVFKRRARVRMQGASGLATDGADHLVGAEGLPVRAVGAECFGDIGHGENPGG